MTDVWRMPAIAPWEKTCGKHPTQKPLSLVVRAVLACTRKNARILDPFTGGGTTGIASNLIGREFTGIDSEEKFLDIAVARRCLMSEKKKEWQNKISDLRTLDGDFGIIDA